MTMGRVDRAADHLSEAICRNLALGHWPAVVASRLRCAEALERRGQHGDVATASELRTRAAELAATLAGDIAVPAWYGQARFSRQGATWRIELGARSAVVEHCVGMLHLAVLIANPGAEIAAIDLVAGLDRLAQAARNTAMPDQQVLDRTAVYQYRQRLTLLRERTSDRKADHEDESADRDQPELDWLQNELGTGTRIGGHVRAFSENGERADADIGAHLRAAVHTGAKCWYRPV